MLAASEGTIRNDLNALADSGQITRVRGGAVLKQEVPLVNTAFATRARVNESAKQRIARWAAERVEDGDSILLDASTTVYYLSHYLKECRHLTVVTNGIEVARQLAQDPTNTVILLGGAMRADGTRVTGLLGERLLADLHVKTAFVSCTGFDPKIGFTENNLPEAQLKSKMIGIARSAVALIDSDKFGEVDLAPFAGPEQISHIYTDSDLPAAWIAKLRTTCISLTVCSEETVSTYSPCGPERHHYRIGFANLGEHIPFAVDVRRGIERAAHEAGNIDLVLADNQLDGTVALEVADRLLAQNLDLVIEYQVDEQAGNVIMDRLRRSGIPAIAVDIPMVGATFFGVDNYGAGHMAGTALGHWIQKQWQGQFDHLLVLEEPRAGATPAARMQGQLAGLQEVIGTIGPSRLIRLDGGNDSGVSEAAVLATLEKLPTLHRLAVLSFNDDVAVGALAAGRKLGREQDLVIVGQGVDRNVRREIRQPGSRIIGSTAYWPERYGEKLIPLVQKILTGEAVPPALHMDHTFINGDNIQRYYPD